MSACSLTSAWLHAAVLLGVSMTTATATEGQNSPPTLGHGDPCGYSANQSLVCCFGVTRSTLIRNTEECCNGSPVGPNQLCCDETVPVTLTSPDDDMCCLNPDTQQGVTFFSSRHYCDYDTGDVVERPFRSSLSNTLGNFQGLPSSSSSEDSWQQESPSFERWCQAGYDVRQSGGPRWRGESVSCCGTVAYFASRQTCCAGVLHDSPAEETLCCYDGAFRRGDPSNPCLGRCGGLEFNSETQLCCEGLIHSTASPSDICCGKGVISPESHTCCGGGVALPRDGPYGCCRGTLPYVRRYTKCPRSGALRRKGRGQFRARAVCGRLPAWSPHWPALRLQAGPSRLHRIEGRVSHINKSHNNSLHLTLRLSGLIQSSALEEHSPVASCVDSQVFHLKVNLGDAEGAGCRGRQLRQYLRHQVLQVFFPLNALVCSDVGIPVVRVPVRSREHLILLTSSDP